MQVQDIMTRGCECTRPDATLEEAARKMRELDVGSLPVCADDGRLAGILTDRDITIRGVATGKDPRTACVCDVMTPGIVHCFEDQDVQDVAQLMEERQIRRLVVLDHDNRTVGIVSLGDLAVECQDERLAGEALERISEPTLA